MKSLDLSGVTPDHQASATWAAVLLHAIAREEAANRLPQRLTEPGLATWNRFKGRLTASDFLALLFEDAAVLHQVPFAASAVAAPARLDRIPRHVVENWLAAVPHLELTGSAADYVTEQAKLLGVNARLARSDLHVVKAHQKVLELPGTGGQLAHHLVSVHPELSLQTNFTVACGTWQEHTLAGIVALANGSPAGDFLVRATPDDLKNPEHPLRNRTFDFVIGLSALKGGAFHVQEQLALWFPTATFVLV
ncbi:MAG: hypothetical protein K1X89_03935 [Myxococcaceae bacterium]|nr:hypothetical protein [Myxococcaceae bacterium]